VSTYWAIVAESRILVERTRRVVNIVAVELTPQPSDITVVVQGPVLGQPHDPPANQLTRRCLLSVRRQLPDAKIVLSTWKGTNVTDLSYDMLVLSEDPGVVWAMVDGVMTTNNVNRQIFSSVNGIRAATTRYVLKLRSDTLLYDTGFLGYFGKFQARNPKWRIFRERVLTVTYYSINPTRGTPWLFCPSDWFFFGLKEDLLQLLDIPLVTTSPEDLNEREHALVKAQPNARPFTRFFNEQFIWLGCLSKFGHIPISRCDEDAPALRTMSELTIANNFVLLGLRQFGAISQKFQFKIEPWLDLYTHEEWVRMYGRFCEPKVRISPTVPRLAKDWLCWTRRHSPLAFRVANRLSQFAFAAWKRLFLSDGL
jgi:hypothetical protein